MVVVSLLVTVAFLVMSEDWRVVVELIDVVSLGLICHADVFRLMLN